jgi:hypothetical protein
MGQARRGAARGCAVHVSCPAPPSPSGAPARNGAVHKVVELRAHVEARAVLRGARSGTWPSAGRADAGQTRGRRGGARTADGCVGLARRTDSLSTPVSTARMVSLPPGPASEPPPAPPGRCAAYVSLPAPPEPGADPLAATPVCVGRWVGRGWRRLGKGGAAAGKAGKAGKAAQRRAALRRRTTAWVMMRYLPYGTAALRVPAPPAAPRRPHLPDGGPALPLPAHAVVPAAAREV